MKPVIFQNEAAAELEDDMAWYEERQAGLGIDLRSEVESTIERIRRDPLLECVIVRRHYNSFGSSDFHTWSTFANLRRRFGSLRSLMVEEGRDTGRIESYDAWHYRFPSKELTI